MLLPDLEFSQVERPFAAALAEPSRHAAVRFLVGMLPVVGLDLPGPRNSGLLAAQELAHGYRRGRTGHGSARPTVSCHLSDSG